MPHDAELESHVAPGLDGDEIRVVGHATNGSFAVTDRGLIVAGPGGVGLSLPYGKVRRIQFDLDRGRPASLAFVSDDAGDAAVVLNIPPEEYRAVTDVLVAIGRQFAALTGDHSSEGLSDYVVPAPHRTTSRWSRPMTLPGRAPVLLDRRNPSHERKRGVGR